MSKQIPDGEIARARLALARITNRANMYGFAAWIWPNSNQTVREDLTILDEFVLKNRELLKGRPIGLLSSIQERIFPRLMLSARRQNPE